MLTQSVPQTVNPSIGARIVFRHTASHTAPRLIAATILAVRDCGGETHVEIQPDTLAFTRWINRNEIKSYLWNDPEQDEFDAERDAETRAHMDLEARIERTAAGVRFELRPGDTDELLWAAKRVLHGADYDPNGGVQHEQPRGGSSRRWIVEGYWRMS